MATLIQSGDIVQAEGHLQRIQAFISEVRTSGSPAKRKSYDITGRSWESDLESARAIVFEARGQYHEAETAYQRSADYRRAWIPQLPKMEYAPPASQVRQAADAQILNLARMKAKQGRLAEAEVDARAVLLSRLKEQGKYNPLTAKYVRGLANILIEGGRYGDAERLIRSAIDIQRTIGIGDDSQQSAQIISQLGAVLTFQRKSVEAAQTYAELDKAIANWEPGRRQVLELNGSRVTALYASGQVEAGISAAQDALKREVSRGRSALRFCCRARHAGDRLFPGQQRC
jgi:tetratricopeptide (TPR) repeat protein